MTIRTKRQYEKALARVELLEKAWEKALAAQSYTIGTEQVNHAQLKEIKSELDELEDAIDAYEASGSSKRKIRRIVPKD